MRHAIAIWIVTALVLLAPQQASATWSIVAVDPASGEVGGASATCTPWAWAIIAVVPGKGVVVTQAESNPEARRKGVELMTAGASPAEIVRAITDPAFDPTHADQQHGVVALGFEKSAAGFTGARTARATGDLQAAGVSVQGNILTGNDVLTAALAAFEAARGDPSLSLAERLLRALEAGSAKGGDHRCQPQTAVSAYLVIARPGDAPDTPSLRIVIKSNHSLGRNAVEVLRERYQESISR